MGFRKKTKAIPTFEEIEAKHREILRGIENSSLSDEAKYFALQSEDARYRTAISNAIHGT